MSEKKQETSSKIGITLKSYSNQFESEPIHHLTEDFGETNTDRSKWRPTLSVARAFLGSDMRSTKKMLYDYDDGKDDGQTIKTFLRTKGLDITEIDQAERVITQIIQDKTVDEQTRQKAEEARKQALSDLSDAIKGENKPTDPQPDNQ